MSIYYHKKKELSRDFFKKINNRHLLIMSTCFVNMGGCRSAPPYSKKKTRHRRLFFRVFKFEKKKIKIFTSNLKKGGLRSLRSRKPRKRVCFAHRIYNGAPPHTPHSPFGRSGVYSTQRKSVALRLCQGQAMCFAPLTPLSLTLSSKFEDSI